MRRIGSGLAITLGTMLIGVGVAAACLEPRGFAGPDAGGPASYGPNDPTPFKITGTDEGAPYTVVVMDGGVPKASFSYQDTDSQQGTKGTFTMPDLGGSARSIEVKFDVAHEGTNYPTSDFVAYQPPAPPPGTDPGTPDGTPGSGSTNHGASHGDRAAPNQAPAQRADPPPLAASPTPAGGGDPASTTQPQRTVDGAAESARAAESQGARAGASTDARTDREDRVGVPAPGLSELAGDDTQVGPIAVPTLSLVLMALILVSGTASLAGVFFVAGRLAPDPDRVAIDVGEALTPAAIEAGLQEMISEARAAASSAGTLEEHPKAGNRS
jgi:hypothetical protein